MIHFALIFLISGFVSLADAEVLRSVSVKSTIDNMLNQILSPLAKKLRELQQTYKFRSLNSTQDQSNQVLAQMAFFGDGASVCGKNENHDIISKLNYKFENIENGWNETIQYAGCDQSVTSLIETIDVRTNPGSNVTPTRLTQNDIVAGRRLVHLQKDEVSRRYTLYNNERQPLLSIVSFKSNAGLNIQIWFGQSKIVSAQIKESDSGESFVYYRHGIDDRINFGFGNLNYRDSTEESIVTQQLQQGTSYYDQLAGEHLSYAKLTAKLNEHLIDVVASLFFRPSIENILSSLFPTGATVAQPSCLRNELLRLEAQFRSGATNNPAVQEFLNTYLPIWRKALDSGELSDSRSQPCK